MNLPSGENPTSDPSAAREEVRRQFLAACEASAGGPPPAVEPFLAAFAEPDRTQLRGELETVRAWYAAGAATVDSLSPAGAGTVDRPPVRQEVSQATLSFEEAPALPSGTLATAEQGGTMDRVSSPGGTVDHAPTAGGTVDDAPTDDGGTVDHSPAPGGTVDHVPPPHSKKSSELAAAQTVAGYEIIGVLGRGAMGVVYKARQRGLKRLVALKMILSGEHASEHDLGRFRSEAEAVARLQHPGIVQIYEVGEDAGRPFFSLEFIDGVSLDKKIRGTPLAAKEAAPLVQQMAQAMEYAHKNGVIHRDLKPANVLLTADGVPKIGDFGLAKRLEEEESGLTRTGTVLGTPSYMAPEQAEGRIHEVGPLADVYSLGAVLYELLTGRPPFRGTTILNTLQLLRTTEPVAPTQLQPGVPRDLETICLKCLQKERGKRYASAGELAADLRRFTNNEPIQARPVSRIERLWRWGRRNPRTAGLIGATAGVVVAWAATASLLAWQLKVKKDEAVEARNKEEEARVAADRSAAEAIHQKGIAEKEKKVAVDIGERQRETADATVKYMIDLANNLLTPLQSKRLAIHGRPEVKKLRTDLLGALRKSLGGVSKKIQATATTTFADLSSATLLADLLKNLGQGSEARELYELGHKAAKQRAEREPNNDRARGNLGVMETRMGDVALDLEGDARTARDRYLAARKLHEEILLHPRARQYAPLEMKRSISHDDVPLGQALLALGRPAEARKYLTEALGYREEWVKAEPQSGEALTYIVQARMWLGAVAWRLDDGKAVQEHFVQALTICQDLLKKFPRSILLTTDLAEVQGMYGDALFRLGGVQEAEKLYLESRQSIEKALAGNPDDLSRQPLLALTHERLAQASARLKKQAEAKTHWQTALQLRMENWEMDKANLPRQASFVAAMARAGDFKQASRLAATIRPRMVKSTELMLQIARCFAVCAALDAAGRTKHVAQALAALTAATRDDYQDAVALATDPDLAAVRDESAFVALLEVVKKR